MRKIIVAFITFIIVIINCISVFADTVPVFDNTEELYIDSEMIVETANKMLSEIVETPIEIDDIDYSKALKVYIDTDILSNDEITVDKIQELINNSNYMYYLPVIIENKSICLTISKGKPVTERAKEILEEEDIQKLQELEGRWYVPQVEVFTGEIDYINQMNTIIEKSNLNVSNVYFFGGLSGNMPLVATCIEDTDVKFKVIDKNRLNTQFGSTDGKNDNELYSFNQIKDIANEGKLNEGEFGSGAIIGKNSLNNILIIALIFVILIIITLLIYVKKRRELKIYEQ